MNNSMQRFLAGRGRYIHVSAPLVKQKVVLFPERSCGGLTLPEVAIEKLVVQKPGSTRFTNRGAFARVGVKGRDVLQA